MSADHEEPAATVPDEQPEEPTVDEQLDESGQAPTEADVPPRRRGLPTIVAGVVTVVAVVAMLLMAFGHRAHLRADDEEIAAVTTAREWVGLLLSTNEDNVVEQFDVISTRTAEPLRTDVVDRVEPYLELLSDDGSGRPLMVTSAAVELAGDRTDRPALPEGARSVLVTTTPRSGQLGRGYSLWVYVVHTGDGFAIANFGSAA
jgi:hypothetical protein